MTAHKRFIRCATAGTALIGTLALSACANPIEQLVNRGAESAVERLIEQGSGGSVDIDTKDGSITLGGEDGDISMNFGSSASLPEGWPDIPTPNGKITMSAKTGEGMQVAFETTPEEAERLLEAFRNGGYESSGSLDLGDIKSENFDKDGLGVAVQVLPGNGDAIIVQMMVFPGDE